MSQYSTGTVAVTNGSAAIVGTGTAWLANVAAGDVFTVSGSNVPYVIGSVTDDTHATLASNYAGATASGLAYSITTSFTPNNALPYPETGDVDTSTILKRAMLLIDTLFAAKNGSASQNFAAATLNAATLSDGYIAIAAGQINRPGAAVELQFAGSAGSVVNIGGNGANPTSINANTGAFSAGAITSATTIKSGGYTVATLPAGTVGMRAYVTDANGPTYNGLLTGGGVSVVPVFYHGSAWVYA